MTGKDRIILQKIINYINEIEQYITDYSFEMFMKDKKTMSACAFSVSQIGELSKEISGDTQSKYDDIPWKSIKGMRNKIVHDYENIDLSVLWGTIIKSLPILKVQIEEIIEIQAETFNILNDENARDIEL
jgi:uncharacterized protein with HEPN domain